MLFRFLLSLFAPLTLASMASAQELAYPQRGSVIICATEQVTGTPPEFAGPNCRALDDFRIDPQQRLIWVKVTIDVSDTLLDLDEPLGLIVMGKASRRIWVNGRDIGRDGQPGASRDAEIAGPMDTVHYLPRDILRSGPNEVVMLMSGHHSLVRLYYPFHLLAISNYQTPQDFLHRHYSVSIFSLGVILAAALYFGVASFRGRDRWGSALIAGLALLAGLQLLAEISRALFGYSYPIHDVRLIALMVFAVAFGLMLFAYVYRQLFSSMSLAWFVLPIAGSVAMMLALPGFDGKTLFGMLFPVVCAVGFSVWSVFKRTPSARAYSVVLILFIGISVFTGGRFLDLFFFVSVAAMLVFLVAQQAIKLRNAEVLAQDFSAKAKRLEQALAEATANRDLQTIDVKSGKRTEAVPVGSIIHCQGAGDYVELNLRDGRQLLANSTLADLEKHLPANFLRVHRSHIVNTAEITSLAREPSGVGTLELKNNSSVPVSRRILPRVRAAI
ncbi:MAG: LytTR family transcriptional regulator DNA-binding domain-containing protein [Pseudomonadota bacterium]